MNDEYIGVSANLSSGATGHFETFHKGIHQALKSENINAKYLGSNLYHHLGNKSWYQPIIPSTLARPLAWSRLGFLRDFEKNKNSSARNQNFFVYEGNFAWSSIFLIYIAMNPNTKALVNLFDSKRYREVIGENIFKRKFISIYMRLIKKLSQSRIIFTADTPILAKELTSVCNFEIKVFPKFSVMFEHEILKVTPEGHRKILVLVRGYIATKNLISALYDFCPDCKIIVHGVDSSDRNKFSTLVNISLTPGFISEDEYKKFYNDIDRCVILYPPEHFSHQSSGRFYDCMTLGIPVSVPKGTSMAAQAIQFGNSRSFVFDSIAEIRGEFQHEIQYSKKSLKKEISKQAFIHDLHQIFSSAVVHSIQKNVVINLVARGIWYLYGIYWLSRGFGLKSWKIIIWKMKERLSQKASKL